MKHRESKESIEAFNKYLKKGLDEKWKESIAYRKANKEWLQKSARIAIKLNRYLKNNQLSQKELAKKMGVSPQQVNKILKGRENLTLETVAKMEKALNIELITVLKSDEMVIKKNLGSIVFIAHEIVKRNYKRSDVTVEINEMIAANTIFMASKDMITTTEKAKTSIRIKSKMSIINYSKAA